MSLTAQLVNGAPPRQHKLGCPSQIWEGEGCSSLVRDQLLRLGAGMCLVVIDPAVRATRAGADLVRLVDDAASASDVFDGVEPNTPLEAVEALAARLEVVRPAAIVAVGGGSTLDLVKAANAVAFGGSGVHEYLGGAPITGRLRPWFAIPTTCGTGSETTPFAVVLDASRRQKRGFESDALLPEAIYLDAQFMRTLPAPYAAATAVDALCHAVESYTSRLATALSRCSALGVVATAARFLRPAAGGDLAAREEMLVASASARLLYPRTGLSIAHALSHPLGAVTGMHHGAAVALLIGPALAFNVERAPRPFAELARSLGHAAGGDDAEDAAALLRWLEDLLSALPLDELRCPVPNAQEQQFIADEAMRSSNIPSNPATATAANLRLVLERAFEQ